MDGLTLVLAVVAFVLLVVLISVLIEVNTRVEIIAHEQAHLKEIANQLETLSKPYKRPLWTSYSSVVHSVATLVKVVPSLPYRRTYVQTRNGQELPIDWLEEGIDDPATPVVVVIPGITGHSKSKYLGHLVRELNRSGKRVAVLSHPGMGDVALKAPRVIVTYDPSDLQDCIDAIHSSYPNAPLQCFAYSLGACLLLNYLGTVGENTPVASAVSVSNPFDIQHCVDYLHTYFVGRHVIDRHFIATYLDAFKRHKDLFINGYGDKINVDKLLKATTVIEWDLHFSLPAYGFNSIEEYYYVSSCAHNLTKIKIPLLVVHAADDPIVPMKAVPIDRLKNNPNIVTAITEHGGHCGWVEGLNTFNRPAWVDRVACEWLDTILKHHRPQTQPLATPNTNKQTSLSSRKRRSSLREALAKA